MSSSPAGHYSSSVVSGHLIFTSGVLPIIDRETKEVNPDIVQQCQLVLERLETIIGEHGLNRNDIIKTTCYLSDGNDWGVVNNVYASFFGDHKPARSIIPVNSLHYGCKIEIEAIAQLR